MIKRGIFHKEKEKHGDYLVDKMLDYLRLFDNKFYVSKLILKI